MAKSKQKYYVVWKGHTPGIYTSWDQCRRQIHGFQGAQYKAVESMAEAEYAIKRNYFDFVKPTIKNDIAAPTKIVSKSEIIHDSICVDAACSGNPGFMEYRCVETTSKKEIFHMGPFQEGTNNIGEFLGLVHALAMLKKLGNNHTVIYTDSITAISWVKAKKSKSTLEKTKHNKEIFDLLSRAEVWLGNNSYKNKIIKWETDSWGEIPADFGRK
jgi:ribonuclease HI